ncbi:MAG: TetR/AcrR family transcriptional regulator [Acidimicrobiales bacterium]
MTTAPQLGEPIDGRTARRVRTRAALVEACLALIDEGDLRPPAPRIAERAGVSVRSVFSHFEDLESLFSAVGDQVTARLTAIVRPIDLAGSCDERLTAFVEQRAEQLELVTPVLRASFVHASTSAVITRQFAEGQALFRRHLSEAFAPELQCAADPDRLQDALMMAASWPSWNMLRDARGRTVDEARRSMRWALAAALATGEDRR